MNKLLNSILACIETNNNGFNKKYIEYVGNYIQNTDKGDYTFADVGCGTGVLFSIPYYYFYGKDDNSLREFECYDVDSASVDWGNNAVYAIFGKQEKIVFKILESKKDSDVFDKDLLPISKQYDIVTCNSVLEHTRNPEKLLKFCAGILKKNGILIITIPNGFGPYEIDSLLYRKFFLPVYPLLRKIKHLFIPVKKQAIKKMNAIAGGGLIESLDKETNHHVQFFTEKKIASLLKKADLKILRKQHFMFLSGPLYNVFLSKFKIVQRINTILAAKVSFQFGNMWCYTLIHSSNNLEGKGGK